MLIGKTKTIPCYEGIYWSLCQIKERRSCVRSAKLKQYNSISNAFTMATRNEKMISKPLDEVKTTNNDEPGYLWNLYFLFIISFYFSNFLF